MNFYGSLCTQLYDLDKPKPPEDEFDFYLGYFKNKDIKILEAMCGSGRFLIPFLEMGYDIEGFDLSEDMLAACRRKASKRNLNCRVMNSKAKDFKSDIKYDLIITPGGSFVTIKEREKLLESLKSMYNCLKPNGKFVIEILTDNIKGSNNNTWKQSKALEREDGKVIVESNQSQYDQSNKLIKYPLKYELIDGGEIIETESMDLYIMLYGIHEFKEILEEVGFKMLKTLRAYTQEAATPEDKTVIYECSKK
ncbi:class I SAM-dependent methyltransferase [Alkaliphilus serpentinus]|uniref:Class I SAM-dependent methyltransferase n=1 Tax=Alkaliphilus serpentinus TaxID=1482731 RepID=A0A833M9G0_9FIRM|nr:class I SAM-dependent methyltransferase [Alkaliphilus serpentinus]KAB3529820.1 class I SAM-dependent methyltransferase [Alkaliphilus serpentinus]